MAPNDDPAPRPHDDAVSDLSVLGHNAMNENERRHVLRVALMANWLTDENGKEIELEALKRVDDSNAAGWLMWQKPD